MGFSAQNIGSLSTWVPVFTGYSVDPGVTTASYSLVGKLCTIVLVTTTGTSNATTTTFTLPFSAAVVASHAGTISFNNGATDTTNLRGDLTVGSNVCTVYRNAAALAWTGSGTKGFRISFTYMIQ